MTCDPDIGDHHPGDPEGHGQDGSDDQGERHGSGVPDEDRPGLSLNPETDRQEVAVKPEKANRGCRCHHPAKSCIGVAEQEPEDRTSEDGGHEAVARNDRNRELVQPE